MNLKKVIFIALVCSPMVVSANNNTLGSEYCDTDNKGDVVENLIQEYAQAQSESEALNLWELLS
ncbi:MAG: hypothetical protein ACI8WB_005663, partial [Phenylobacterium sp.]